MNLNLKQLQAFARVAETGSFRKAAERLKTTQPNISMRIATLEETLGAKLLDREGGSVQLTAKGQELLPQARRILQETDRFLSMGEKPQQLNAVLKLGVTEMIVHTWLREFLRRLKEVFPDLTVELTVDVSANLSNELFANTIDLALQSGPFNRQTAGHVDLGTYPLVWVGAPDVAKSIKQTAAGQKQSSEKYSQEASLKAGTVREITTAAMVKHPIITHARGTKPFEAVSEHFATTARGRYARAARIVPSSNLAACLHMTMDGLGIAAILKAMVEKELAAGELAVIPYDWVPDDLRFLARYHGDKAPSFVAKAAEIAADVSFGRG